MSERKSWDIQPKRREIPQPAPKPVVAPVPTRTRPQVRRKPQQVVRQKRAPEKEHSREPVRATAAMRPKKVLQGKDREPLKKSRRRAQKRLNTVVSILVVLAIIGLYSCIWLPVFRIQHVEAAGPDATQIQTDTQNAITGTFEYVLPRNSIFFFPESEIRDQLLTQYADVSAIEISRTSFDSISLVSIPREVAFEWCGTTYSSTSSSQAVVTASSTDSGNLVMLPCYNSDSQGFIFSDAPTFLQDELKVYGPLLASTTNPIGMHIAHAGSIPNALEFVKDIKALDVPITALVIRDDEADLYAQSGTRITYVLGQEQSANQLATSAFPSLNFGDGSLEYVDLRFGDKVYFKKFGSDQSGTTVSTTTAQ